MPPATQAGLGLLSLALAACAATSAQFATRDLPESEAPRRAPGVAVDPKTALPEPARTANTDSGVAVLSAPRDLQRATALVDEFFRAITGESSESLDRIVSSDAYVESASGRQPVRVAWRSRFTQFDYGALRSAPLYRPGDLETYRGRDRDALGPARRLPSQMQPDDVFVRVQLDVTHASKTRLFADELGFLLRPSGNGYRIASISEDFQAP
jgi:hypothetical protein